MHQIQLGPLLWIYLASELESAVDTKLDPAFLPLVRPCILYLDMSQVHHCKPWQVLGISEVISLRFADGAWPL